MRVTPYGAETIEVQFQSNIAFGQRVTAEIPRNGDLVGKIFIKLQTPVLTGTATQAWINELGHYFINNVEVEVGGQRIDRHYGFMFSALQELMGVAEKKDGYDEMIGNTPDMTQEATSIPSKYLYIPLRFWFNKDSGSYLPLVALQKHQVKINLEIAQFASLYKTSTSSTVTSTTIPYCSLLVDYIFLDTPERRQFARMAHEYLTETIQYTSADQTTSTTFQQRLNFNHPITELITVAQLQSQQTANNWNSWSNTDGTDLVSQIKVQVNGQDYEREQEGRYYRLVTPWKVHTCVPQRPVYVFPFALKPEEFQPSGSINASRLDTLIVNFTLNNGGSSTLLYTFAPNKNVFRVLSGMGGLAYSN